MSAVSYCTAQLTLGISLVFKKGKDSCWRRASVKKNLWFVVVTTKDFEQVSYRNYWELCYGTWNPLWKVLLVISNFWVPKRTKLRQNHNFKHVPDRFITSRMSSIWTFLNPDLRGTRRTTDKWCSWKNCIFNHIPVTCKASFKFVMKIGTQL